MVEMVLQKAAPALWLWPREQNLVSSYSNSGTCPQPNSKLPQCRTEQTSSISKPESLRQAQLVLWCEYFHTVCVDIFKYVIKPSSQVIFSTWQWYESDSYPAELLIFWILSFGHHPDQWYLVPCSPNCMARLRLSSVGGTVHEEAADTLQRAFHLDSCCPKQFYMTMGHKCIT